jgi:hypothetical protein
MKNLTLPIDLTLGLGESRGTSGEGAPLVVSTPSTSISQREDVIVDFVRGNCFVLFVRKVMIITVTPPSSPPYPALRIFLF